MDIRWTRRALDDLKTAYARLEQDNFLLARDMVRALRHLLAQLPGQTHLGRKGSVDTTRELQIPGTPYLLIYREVAGNLEILRIAHGRRRV